MKNKKIGKRNCLRLLSETLHRAYGRELFIGDDDLFIARAIMKSLKPYLRIDSPSRDISRWEFNKKREKFISKTIKENIKNEMRWGD